MTISDEGERAETARRSLSDTDISTTSSVSRRTLIGSLGLGIGLAATGTLGVLGSSTRATAADAPGRGRSCNFRDGDSVTRKQDNVRQSCGLTDNDSRDRSNASSRCGFRDSDTTRTVARDTVRVNCGRTDSDS